VHVVPRTTQLDGLAQLHDYQASHGMKTESEAGPALKPGSGDDDDDEIKKKEHHKHHKHHKDESEDGQQYIKDGVVMHPWVSSAVPRAKSGAWRWQQWTAGNAETLVVLCHFHMPGNCFAH